MEFADLQSSPDLILDDGTVKTVCDRCRETWSRSKKEAPCESCRVELQAENEDAARIFMMVRNQTLSNGAINHLAVWAAIDGYGIRDRVETFEKVMRCFYSIMNERQGNGTD